MLYIRDILYKDKRPSVVSWLLWAVTANLNFFSYKTMSSWVVALLAFTSSLMCIITLLAAVTKLTLKKPTLIDYITLALGLASIVVWVLLGSATNANLIVLAAIALGFFATYRNALQNPADEPVSAWTVWTAGFFLALIVVILKWEGNYSQLYYPCMMLALSLAMAVLLRRKRGPREAIRESQVINQ